jgi:hypothetical protein
MLCKQDILLNENIRNDIFKNNWSRIISIKYNKLKYISKPYTHRDLNMALKYDSYDLIVKFLDNLALKSKIDIWVINSCKSLKTFKYVYNFFRNIYSLEDMVKILETSFYVKENKLEIIDFIYDEGFAIDANEFPSVAMFKLLTNKCRVDWRSIPVSNFDTSVKIHLIEDGIIDYRLENAILEGDLDMIDYFLIEKAEEMSPDQESLLRFLDYDYWFRLDTYYDDNEY